MRFSRLIVAVLSIGLLGLPALLLSASSATAAEPSFQTRLKLWSTPRAQLYNHTVSVVGRVEAFDPSDSAWHGVPDAAVVLDRRTAPSTRFKAFRSRRTDDGGRFTFAFHALANAAHRVRFSGGYLDSVDATFDPSVSVTKAVKVYRNLGARQHRIGGRKFAFFGRVSPKYAKRLVTLQRQTCATCSWKTLAKQRTTERGTWHFVVLAKPGRGVWKYRSVIKAGPRYVRSYSAVFKVSTLVR